MPKPYRTALMPVGTVIEHDSDTYRKTHNSRYEPFPWTLATGDGRNGADYGDERLSHLLDDGGRVVFNPYEIGEEGDRG